MAGIPSTLGQLAAFVALLLPGLAYIIHRERHRPTPKTSGFRESATVIFASTVIDLLVLCSAVLLVKWSPCLGIDRITLATSPSDLAADEFVAILWRAAGLLLVAVLVGWWAGSAQAHALAAKLHLADRGRSAGSAWWVLFKRLDDLTPYVGVELTDGQWIEGYLGAWSDGAEDSPDRELTISNPIKYRPVGESDVVLMNGVDVVTISARNILYLRVTYLPADAEAQAEAVAGTE